MVRKIYVLHKWTITNLDHCTFLIIPLLYIIWRFSVSHIAHWSSLHLFTQSRRTNTLAYMHTLDSPAIRAVGEVTSVTGIRRPLAVAARNVKPHEIYVLVFSTRQMIHCARLFAPRIHQPLYRGSHPLQRWVIIINFKYFIYLICGSACRVYVHQTNTHTHTYRRWTAFRNHFTQYTYIERKRAPQRKCDKPKGSRQEYTSRKSPAFSRRCSAETRCRIVWQRQTNSLRRYTIHIISIEGLKAS